MMIIRIMTATIITMTLIVMTITMMTSILMVIMIMMMIMVMMVKSLIDINLKGMKVIIMNAKHYNQQADRQVNKTGSDAGK